WLFPQAILVDMRSRSKMTPRSGLGAKRVDVYAHALALKKSGALWSWGYNVHAQLGNGTTTATVSPGQIGTSTNWLSIATSVYSSFALQRDGSLWSCGSSFY